MAKPLFPRVAVILLTALAACDSPDPNALAAQFFAKMEQFPPLLEEIDDEASLQAATAKVDALLAELKVLREDLEALPESEAEAAGRLEQLAMAVTLKTNSEIQRVMETIDPELQPKVEELVRRYRATIL